MIEMRMQLLAWNSQNNTFARYQTTIVVMQTDTEGCQSYDATLKTRESIIHENGMPKVNMLKKIRAIISVFDLNRTLSDSGKVSTMITATRRGSAPNKAR